MSLLSVPCLQVLTAFLSPLARGAAEAPCTTCASFLLQVCKSLPVRGQLAHSWARHDQRHNLKPTGDHKSTLLRVGATLRAGSSSTD